MGWEVCMTEDFEEVKNLLRHTSEAALGTLEAGRPFVSGTGFVLEGEEKLEVALLLSDLSRHTRNIKKNPAVSLLVVEENPQSSIHEKVRATLIGEVKLITDQDRFERLKKTYLKQFPRSDIFFSLPDFRFYELKPSEIHWIGGFGKAGTYAWENGNWKYQRGGNTPSTDSAIASP